MQRGRGDPVFDINPSMARDPKVDERQGWTKFLFNGVQLLDTMRLAFPLIGTRVGSNTLP